MMKQLAAVALALGLSIGQTRVAFAEEASTPAHAEAAERFERGLELYHDGALDAALAEFERAYELTLDYRVLYNIGYVQSQRHRYVEAIEAFERYLKGPDVAEARREQVLAELEKLRGRTAWLSLESDVSGATAFVNGVSVGTLPLSQPIRVNPGLCEIRVEKAGYQSTRDTISIVGGDTPRHTVLLTPVASSETSPRTAAPEAEPAKVRYNYTPFWVSAASAAALGGGAAVMGVLALNKQSELEAELGDPPSDPGQVDALRSDGKTFAAVADGLAAGAIVAAGIGIYFLIDPPKKKEHAVGGLSDVRVSAGAGQAFLSGRFW